VAPIERMANEILSGAAPFKPAGGAKAKIEIHDPRPAYLKRLGKTLPLARLRRAKLKIVADPLYGAGIGYLDEALTKAGCRVTLLHNWRDPLFGGEPPEPNAERMQEAAGVMKKQKAVLALGTDGDADRFGVVDRDGTFFTPNQVLALTVYLLVKHRGWEGRVVRSVVTSHLVDAVAKHYQLPVEVTPVGFKYIGESMQRPGFLVGGEESGGLTIANHVPEKDGILACLLMAELVAREKKSLGVILKNIFKDVGTYLTDRVNVHLESTASGDRLREFLRTFLPTRLADQKVAKVDTTDGFKYILEDGTWLAFRLSGTEPVARLYVEARTPKGLKRLVAEGKLILEKK
jgi:phosphoglucomutase